MDRKDPRDTMWSGAPDSEKEECVIQAMKAGVPITLNHRF